MMNEVLGMLLQYRNAQSFGYSRYLLEEELTDAGAHSSDVTLTVAQLIAVLCLHPDVVEALVEVPLLEATLALDRDVQ